MDRPPGDRARAGRACLAMGDRMNSIQAERKAGEWLRENVSAGNPQFLQGARNGQLPEGIDWYESSRWQLEAALPVQP